MQYMFLVYMDEKAWWSRSEEERTQAMEECAPKCDELRAKGKLLGGAPLQPTTMATTVKVLNGKRVVTDGPFAETREQLGGYTLIEADNLDEAIEFAGNLLRPDAPSTIEIRPLVRFDAVAPIENREAVGASRR